MFRQRTSVGSCWRRSAPRALQRGSITSLANTTSNDTELRSTRLEALRDSTKMRSALLTPRNLVEVCIFSIYFFLILPLSVTPLLLFGNSVKRFTKVLQKSTIKSVQLRWSLIFQHLSKEACFASKNFIASCIYRRLYLQKTRECRESGEIRKEPSINTGGQISFLLRFFFQKLNPLSSNCTTMFIFSPKSDTFPCASTSRNGLNESKRWELRWNPSFIIA